MTGVQTCALPIFPILLLNKSNFSLSGSGPSLLTGFLGGVLVSSMPLLAFAPFHVSSFDLIFFPTQPYRAHLLNLRGRWSGEGGANGEPSQSPPSIQLPLGPTRLRLGGSWPRASPRRWHLRRVWSKARRGRLPALLPSELPNARLPHEFLRFSEALESVQLSCERRVAPPKVEGDQKSVV